MFNKPVKYSILLTKYAAERYENGVLIKECTDAGSLNENGTTAFIKLLSVHVCMLGTAHLEFESEHTIRKPCLFTGEFLFFVNSLINIYGCII